MEKSIAASCELRDRERPVNFVEARSLKLEATSRGFTLLELMVSVTLFTIVMMVAVGSLLSLVDANRKARSLESVINNLNITLDGMVRSIRMGTKYNCTDAAIPVQGVDDDCTTGATSFSFAPFGSNADVQNQRFYYTFVPGVNGSNGQLFRSKNGGNTPPVAITAPEVSITDFTFYVVGTEARDISQPKVVIVIKGTSGSTERTQTKFHIQATAVQRTLDI